MLTRLNGFIAAALVLVMFVCSTSCNRWSLSSDRKARGAVLALEKLQARVEAGMSLQDYSVALGEADLIVKRFLESDKAKSAREFSNSLRNATKWYAGAEQLWHRQLESPVPIGYCSPDGLPSFNANDLCVSYPQLVTTVPGKIPSTTDSLQSSVALVPFEATLAVMQTSRGEAFEGSPGLIYHLAVLESWRRANFELKNAHRLINGKSMEQANEEWFKNEKQSELRYLVNEADKLRSNN